MRTTTIAVPKHRKPTYRRHIVTVVLSATLAVAGLGTIEDQAHAAPWHQPWGGCEETTLAPHSEAAQDCRDHGWTIHRRLAVNPHRLLVGSGLPSCIHEDGSGQDNICSWNFPGHHDGNGIGLSYYVTGTLHHRIAHYVWRHRPHDPWSWVTREQDGWISEAVNGGRDWTHCKIKRAHGQYTVRCPDGAGVRIAA